MPNASCRHRGKNEFLHSDLITAGQRVMMVIEKTLSGYLICNGLRIFRVVYTHFTLQNFLKAF